MLRRSVRKLGHMLVQRGGQLVRVLVHERLHGRVLRDGDIDVAVCLVAVSKRRHVFRVRRRVLVRVHVELFGNHVRSMFRRLDNQANNNSHSDYNHNLDWSLRRLERSLLQLLCQPEFFWPQRLY